MYRIFVRITEKSEGFVKGRVEFAESSNGSLSVIARREFTAFPGDISFDGDDDWSEMPDRLRVQAIQMIWAYCQGVAGDDYLVGWDYETGDQSVWECLLSPNKRKNQRVGS